MLKSVKNMSYGELRKLREQYVEVTDEVFVLLSNTNEFEVRKEWAERYGSYSNVKFFSDGSVFIDGRHGRGVTGWIKAPLLHEIPPT